MHVNSSGGKFATFQIPALHIIFTEAGDVTYHGQKIYCKAQFQL